MADPDKLARLSQVRGQIRMLEEEADQLKADLLADDLQGDGQVYFTDALGRKTRGFYSDSERVTVDLDLLREQLGEDIYRAVTKDRALDSEKFKAAIGRGDIPPEVAVLVAKIDRWKPTVRFETVDDDA